MNTTEFFKKGNNINPDKNILEKFNIYTQKVYQILKGIFYRYILLKPRARGIINVSIDNAEMYFNDGKNDTKTCKLVDREDIEIQQPKFLQGDFLKVISPFKNEIGSVIIDTKNPDFSFRNDHVLDQNLNVLYEPDIEFKDLPIAYRRFLPECKRLNGTIAYLSNTEPHNYGHWFIYTLPMLRVYWKFIDKQEIDYYYIGDCSIDDFKIETLNALGIKKKQIVNYPCKADRALTCIIDRKKQNFGYKYPDIFAYRFARNIFLPNETDSKKKYPKRLYVKRGDVSYRKLINEEVVLEYLGNLGFEALTMQGRTVEEQADIYYNADVVISVCGSALTNLLFVKENIKVIEIFPFGYLDGFFFALASYSKANYYYIIGDEISRTHTRPIFADVKVNIDKLKRICELANLTA